MRLEAQMLDSRSTISRHARLLTLAASTGIVVILTLLIVLQNFLVIGIILAVPLIVWAFLNHRIALVVLVVWTFLQNIPGSYISPILKDLDLLDELLLIALTLRWVIPVLMGKRRARKTPIDVPIVLFLILYIFSLFWNGVPILNGIFAFRDTFQYVLLFYYLANMDYQKNYLFRCIDIMYLTVLANFVVLIIQTMVHFYATGNLFVEDMGVGLMGVSGAHKLGYLAGMLFIGYTARYLVNRGLSWFWYLILGSTIVLTSTRAVYFWVPIALFVMFIPKIVRNGRLLLRAFVIATCFFAIVIIYVSLPITQSATINPYSLYKQQLGLYSEVGGEKEAGSLRRVGFFNYSWQVLTNHNQILGTGPGTYVSKTGSRLGSDLYMNYQRDFPFPNAFPTGMQVSLTIVEYGILGSILILLVHWRIYRAAGRWAKRLRDPGARVLAYGTQGMIVMTILSLISINVFELQEVMFVPWFFFGALTNLQHAEASQPERSTLEAETAKNQIG